MGHSVAKLARCFLYRVIQSDVINQITSLFNQWRAIETHASSTPDESGAKCKETIFPKALYLLIG